MSASRPFPRLFTVAEANDLLPTLRPLMERIFQSLEFLRSRSETVIREEELSPDRPDLMEKLKGDDSVARAIHEIRELVEEISSFGCMCKGLEQGLVDFPCLLGEEIVFLCWRHGEESLGHWHRVQDGFVGRRTLLDLDEKDWISYH